MVFLLLVPSALAFVGPVMVPSVSPPLGRRRASLAEQLTELKYPEKPKKHNASQPLDMASAAAAIAGLTTLGLLVPATDLELATVAAVTAGYAATQNDSSVSELFRAVGRLGETTLRKGLDATFGVHNATIREEGLPPEAARVHPKPASELGRPEPVLEVRETTSTTPSSWYGWHRPLDPRQAAAVRADAQAELATVAARERDLRKLETQLRAAQAAAAVNARAAPTPPPDDPHHLAELIKSLDAVKSNLNAEPVLAHKLRPDLEAYETKLRSQEASVRAWFYDADRAAATARRDHALSKLHADLDALERRRQLAMAKLARASVCVVRSI